MLIKCNLQDADMRKILTVVFIMLLCINIHTLDKIDDLSFVDTDITQVLKTISEAFGITIVPDRDVQGNVTRYFKDTNLEQTLALLLEPLGFTYEVKDGIYFVKKKPPFKVEYDENNKVFTIYSTTGILKDILNEMSLQSKQTITLESSTNDQISINIFNKNLDEALKLLTQDKKYQITKDDNGYYVKKEEDEADFSGLNTKGAKFFLKGNEDTIELKAANQSSNDIILALFRKYNKRLSLLSNKSVKIPYLDVKDIPFDDLLNTIFEHSGQSFTKVNDVYYIYDSLKPNQTNSYMVSGSYKLKNLNYKTFAFNIPSQIVPQSTYKFDTESNSVIVFGSPDEVDRYLSYIKSIDMSLKDYECRIFKLENIDVKNIKNYLPDNYKQLELSIIEDQNMFTVYLDNYDYSKLKNYIDQIDKSFTKEFKYKFKYLKPDDVMKSMLPSYIKKEQVIYNENDSSLIFYVPNGIKEELKKYFNSIDVPTPVIRYELLIVEYINNNSFKFNWGAGIKKGDIGKIGDIGFEGGIFMDANSTISANFDFPTVFGHYFTIFLEEQLYEQRANIQMSTEVYGLSGQTVDLTNTQTLQYKDFITDETTKEQKPVYNSTTFGLNLEIKGRATSYDEVYLEVTARVSDQLGNTPAGQAPDTTEKSIKNYIRTKTGKPIVLGGLTSQKQTYASNKIPGLADIPILGELFKTHDDAFTNSEFVIYIIPFIQKSQQDIKKERQQYIEKMYNYFVSK